MDIVQLFSGVVSFCLGICLFILSYPFSKSSILFIPCGIILIFVSFWILKDREEQIEEVKKIRIKGGRK